MCIIFKPTVLSVTLPISLCAYNLHPTMLIKSESLSIWSLASTKATTISITKETKIAIAPEVIS